MFRKAKALIRLTKVEEGVQILKQLEMKEAKDELKCIELIKDQVNGNYDKFLENYTPYLTKQIL